MKNLFYFLFFSLFIVSCSTDDINEVKSLEERLLQDSWFFQRHGEVCSNGYDLGEGDAYEFKFLPDNTVEFIDPGYLTSSSYVLNGNELTLETIYTLPSGDKRKFIGNYIFSENTTRFTGNNTFVAYDENETHWTCEGTTSIFR
jgi:hypothetical protein